MNRKAKIAYAHIIIGLLVFLIGLITILNYILDRNKSESEEDIIHQMKQARKQRKFNLTEASEEDGEENLYMFISWYCRQMKSTPHQDDRSTNRVPSSLPFSSSPMLNSVISFLLCSTDTIYLVIIVCLALFGSIVLLYGCIRFYQNDIKLLQQNYDESGTSSEEVLNNSDDEKTTLADMLLCCLNLNSSQANKPPSPSKTNINVTPTNQTNPTNPTNPTNLFSSTFDEIQTNRGVSNALYGNYIIERDMKRRRAERMCPFVYDELPAFILENKAVSLALLFDNNNVETVAGFPRVSSPSPHKPPPAPRHLPQLPRSKPPRLNKAVIYSNSLNNSPCLNNPIYKNTYCVESDENIDYTLTRQPKMYSLVIERENKRKLIDCEFDFKSNLKRNSAVQFDKNQECFL